MSFAARARTKSMEVDLKLLTFSKKKKKNEVSNSEAGPADVAAGFIFLLTATAHLCLFCISK